MQTPSPMPALATAIQKLYSTDNNQERQQLMDYFQQLGKNLF